MNKITLVIEKERIREYEKMSISVSAPDFLIPMDFIEYEENYRAIYNLNGYIKMDEIEMLTVRDVFDCIEGIIETYRKALRFFIIPERLEVNGDTVFFNRNERHVRILFLPSIKCVKTVSEQLLSFIDYLMELNATSGAIEYLEMFKAYAMDNNGLKELQNRALMIKREAKLCGVK